jgi:hypothetical protein
MRMFTTRMDDSPWEQSQKSDAALRRLAGSTDFTALLGYAGHRAHHADPAWRRTSGFLAVLRFQWPVLVHEGAGWPHQPP